MQCVRLVLVGYGTIGVVKDVVVRASFFDFAGRKGDGACGCVDGMERWFQNRFGEGHFPAPGLHHFQVLPGIGVHQEENLHHLVVFSHQFQRAGGDFAGTQVATRQPF